MTEKRPYRVKPGQTFGVRADYGPGDIVELTEREATGLLDKLEPVEANAEQPGKKLVTTVAPEVDDQSEEQAEESDDEPDDQRYLTLPGSVIVALQDGGYFEDDVIRGATDDELLALDGVGPGTLRKIRALYTE